MYAPSRLARHPAATSQELPCGETTGGNLGETRGPLRGQRPQATRGVAHQVVGTVIVAAAVALAAACGGSSHAATQAPSPTRATTAGSGSAVASPTPSGPYTPPALPMPATSGALHQQADVVFPTTAISSLTGFDATEAPDGSVFVATATTPNGPDTVVYVVDGTAAPVTAEHVPAGVLGLAADDTDLYIATATTITAYDRTGGAPVRSWPVGFGTAAAGHSMKVGGGALWAEVANPQRIVELAPDTTAITTIAANATNIDSFAVDDSGIYFVESGGATLVHVSTAGARSTAPTDQTVNLQLSGPAAVGAVAVVGSTLVVDHAAGQGLDASLVTFDAGSLRFHASAATNQATAAVVSTLAGPLVFEVAADAGSGADGAPSANFVARVRLATAATSPAFTLTAEQSSGNGELLGPYQSALIDESGVLHLLRIG